MQQTEQQLTWEDILSIIKQIVFQKSLEIDYHFKCEMVSILTDHVIKKSHKLNVEKPKAYLNVMIRNKIRDIIRDERRRINRMNKAINELNER